MATTTRRSPVRQTGGRTILVADRDQRSRVATVAILRRLGFDVTEAESTRIALSRARAGSYSCGILDLNLSESGPFDLCRRLLATSGWTWTPVIFTSSRPPELDLRSALQDGGFAYLLKPFRSDELLAAVGDALAASVPLREARPDRRSVLAQAEAAAG